MFFLFCYVIVKIGEKMDILLKKLKKNLNDMDKVLLVFTMLMFIFGLFNVVAASSRAVVIRYNTSLYSFFYKQAFTIGIGIFISAIIINIPTSKYKNLCSFLFVFVLCLLGYLSLYGTEKSGNINWIKIKGFTLQPSELAKPTLILCLAMIFERFYKSLRNKKIKHWKMILIIIIIGCCYPAIVFTQHDIGTMCILFGIFLFLFLASPILKFDKFKTILIGGCFLVFVLSLYVSKKGSVLSNTQQSRLDFFDPCSKYENGGYQICNGFIAINDGGIFGLGIGKSKQITYIPESHTDSVFAIIAEQYGFWFTTLIFIFYLTILKRIFNISMNATTIRGRYIALGVGFYLFLHILVNLGGLFGVLPLTGVPLPFLSYGGSFTVSSFIALALVQRVQIETKNKKIKVDLKHS